LNSIARHRRLVLGIYIIVLFGVTLAPLPSNREVAELLPFLDRLVGVLDKIVHAVLFGGLTLLLLWNLGWSGRPEALLQAVGLALAGAVLVEVFQSPLPYRHGDLLDIAAGGAGAVAAAIAASLLVRLSRPAPPTGA
jgi:VanZ family protein